MIALREVHKRLGGAAILRGVDLEVGPGEVVALVGPSGGGKSVLLKHVIGLLVPDHGDVLVDGASIARAGSRELARLRRRMGYVFQDAALLDSLTVRENLLLALEDDACRVDPRHADRRIAEALDLVNLEPAVLPRFPAQLSGGMRKRVGVARAVINGPEVILYDEPSTGLDPRNVEVINDLVLAARERFMATSIVITHDLSSLRRIADRVLLLLDGRIFFDGSPDDFFTSADPAVRSFIGVATHPHTETAPWPPIDAGATS